LATIPFLLLLRPVAKNAPASVEHMAVD